MLKSWRICLLFFCSKDLNVKLELPDEFFSMRISKGLYFFG